MSSYYPDKFVVVKLTSPKYGIIHKVLASWYGGYTGSDSWKLSSSITKIIETETGYEFINHSGSIYYCSKETYGMSSYTFSIYNGYVKQIEETQESIIIEIVDEKAIDSVEV